MIFLFVSQNLPGNENFRNDELKGLYDRGLLSPDV